MTNTTTPVLHPAILATAEKALAFIRGGNATITIVGKTARYTYRIRKAKDGDLFFVSLLTGSDNETAYSYIGCLTDVRGFWTTAKTQNPASAPVYGFGWVMQRLRANIMPTGMEIWHEGKCCKCNRKLTDPESIERGIGPECAGTRNKGRKRNVASQYKYGIQYVKAGDPIPTTNAIVVITE